MPTERERGMVWRKKPVTVEAVHYDGTRASFDALWAWACPSGDTLDSPVHYTGPSDDEPGDLMVQTSEGELRARPGCWIIRGVQGEYYPCQPDIFAATYEPVVPELSPEHPAKPLREYLEMLLECGEGLTSMKLYGACWRVVQQLGYRRLVTYTLATELGASLKGAGWRCYGEAGGGSWSREGRPRVDLSPTQTKLRWEAA